MEECQQGNTSIHGEYVNPVDGFGWDTTSDAIVVSGSGDNFTHVTLTNILFTHWRGEIIKSLDGSTNGNANIFNCDFMDGNATAINYYPALDVSNCLFNNLFQIGEYYQEYYRSPTYFQNNLFTNITGNGLAINGGIGTNPPLYIQNNVFYFPGNGRNGIETTPGDNVVISNNQIAFTGQN